MIVRNPSGKAELQRAIEVAAVAFPDTPIEQWAESFENVAELFGLRYVMIVEDEGLIVSTLICQPRPVYINGSPVSHASTGAVATLPEARKKGFAGEMLAQTVRMLRSEKVCLSSLWTGLYPFYRRVGWEAGSEVKIYSAPGKVYAEIGDASRVRSAKEGELGNIKAIYDDWAQDHNCLTSRSDVWWDKVTRVREPLKMVTEPGTDMGFVVHTTGDQVDGYAAYKFVQDKENQVINVFEIAFSEPAHRRDMLAALGSLVGDGRLAMYAPCDDLFLHEVPNPRTISTSVNTSFQFRVVDPVEAMKNLTIDEGAQGAASFSISDPVFNEGWDFGVEADGEKLRITKPASKRRLEMDIQTFAQLYSGYLKPYDAWELGRIRADGDAMEMLICAGDIFSPLTPYRTCLEPG